LWPPPPRPPGPLPLIATAAAFASPLAGSHARNKLSQLKGQIGWISGRRNHTKEAHIGISSPQNLAGPSVFRNHSPVSGRKLAQFTALHLTHFECPEYFSFVNEQTAVYIRVSTNGQKTDSQKSELLSGFGFLHAR
jgi:hypothetical protein